MNATPAADAERRHIVSILLPRVEACVRGLAVPGVDTRETVRRLLDGEGPPDALKHLRALRSLVTMHDNHNVVEAALREVFDLVLALT